MIDHVPASLKRLPHIRALSMRVFPASPRSMIVLGGSVPHEVFAFDNKLKCDCTAATYGRDCAHVKAIEHVYAQSNAGKDISSMFTVDRSSSQERGTPVPLPRKQKQLYGGILSVWFTLETQYGMSIGIKALTTHSAAGKSWEKLEQITESVTFLSPKWWHNDKKGESSHLLAFVCALTGQSPQEVLPLNNDDIKKVINERVGTGILFAASIETDKKGIERNTIDKDSFSAPDTSFSKLAGAMSAKVDVKEDKNGFVYVAKPQPTYETEGAGVDDLLGDDLANEVPF